MHSRTNSSRGTGEEIARGRMLLSKAETIKSLQPYNGMKRLIPVSSRHGANYETVSALKCRLFKNISSFFGCSFCFSFPLPQQTILCKMIGIPLASENAPPQPPVLCVFPPSYPHPYHKAEKGLGRSAALARDLTFPFILLFGTADFSVRPEDFNLLLLGEVLQIAVDCLVLPGPSLWQAAAR